jgi:hypothetical protein
MTSIHQPARGSPSGLGATNETAVSALARSAFPSGSVASASQVRARLLTLLLLVGGAFGAPVAVSALSNSSPRCHRGFLAADEVVSYTPLNSAVWGDFDEDGREDAAVAWDYDGTTVLLNRGNEIFVHGAFEVMPTFYLKLQFADDLNGDGHLDLVVRGGSYIWSRFGDGQGQFGAFVATPPVAYAQQWRVADMDGDGRDDFIDRDTGVVRVLRAEEDGTFAVAATLSATGWDSYMPAFAVGDFNGDGTADIVGAGHDPTTHTPVLHFFWNYGGLTFSEERVTLKPLTLPATLNPVDVDGDGAVEIVGANLGELLIVHAREGELEIDLREVAGLTLVNALGMADLDMDGHSDLVLTRGPTTAVLWGEETATLGPLSTFRIAGATELTLADVNADGVLDVAARSGVRGLPVMHGARGSRNLDAASLHTLWYSGTPTAVAADFDSDGTMDLAASDSSLGTTEILLGDGEGGFRRGPSFSASGLAAAVADFDGDGALDVALSPRFSTEGLSILFGDGAGNFTPVAYPFQGLVLDAGAIAGEPRQALITLRDLEIGVVRIAPDRTAGLEPVYALGSAVWRIAVGDLDRDGDSDLVIDELGAPLRTVLQAGTPWSAGLPVLGQTGASVEDITLGDVNSDGWLDIVAWEATGFSLYKYLPGGGFVFSEWSEVPAFLKAAALRDIDGDDRPDLILVAGSGDSAEVYTKRNVGTHFESSASATATRPALLFVFDVNSDGWPDCILVGWDGIEVMSNTCQTPRIRTQTIPERPRAGEAVELLVRVLPSQAYSIGLLTVYEGSTLLLSTQPYDFATASWSSPGLAAGAHVFDLTYRDQYAGTSEEVLDLFVTLAGGSDTPAIYRSSDRSWYLKNSTTGGAADLVFPYGDPADQAVKGDWDGNGTDTVGIYRDGVFYLKNTNGPGNADVVIGFGVPGDIPVAGDWDGDGVDTIGVYRPSEAAWFLRNSNSAGAPDLSFTFGLADETPVVGDWDGDGIDTVGIFRASDRQWYLHNSNAGGNAELVFPYGDPAQDVPVVGDWDGDGDDTVGIYRAALGEWFLKNTNEAGFADLNFVYGLVNEKPLAGDWDGQ